MALTRKQKEEQMVNIKTNLKDVKSYVLINYTGITAEQDTKLRAELREAGLVYKVYKNRLLKKVLNELGVTECDPYLTEGTAIAFSYDDVTAPARIIDKNKKDIPALTFKCGFVEGKFVDAEQLEKLAKIPSKEVLLGQLVGLLQGMVGGLARVLAAVAEQKEN